ncbi:hypothetical protein ACLM5H_15765 [Fredinandcohnia humi]
MAKKIRIKKGEREIIATEKAFRVVYSTFGYKKVGEVEDTQKDNQTNGVNLYELSEAELQKVLKDDIKAFLDGEEIEYDSNATKDELIKIVLGE